MGNYFASKIQNPEKIAFDTCMKELRGYIHFTMSDMSTDVEQEAETWRILSCYDYQRLSPSNQKKFVQLECKRRNISPWVYYATFNKS